MIPEKVKSGKSIALENQDKSTKASTLLSIKDGSDAPSSSLSTISSSKDDSRSSEGSSLLWDGIEDSMDFMGYDHVEQGCMNSLINGIKSLFCEEKFTMV
jgi:hypothetical protein